jgi:putative DNA primase/helicase
MVIRGQIAYCMWEGQGSYKQRTDATGNVGYLHRLTDERPPRTTIPPCPKGTTLARADNDVLHRVYTALLTRLGPMAATSPRRAALRVRGFSDAAIAARGYRDFPGVMGRARLAKLLQEQSPTSLLHVPGFVAKERDGRRYHTIAAKDGFLIPIRDRHEQIHAVKVRSDKDAPKYYYLSSHKDYWAGPKALELIHVPLGTNLDGPELRVTEGPLKADVCAELAPTLPTVALPSASSTELLRAFLADLPHVQTVRIALDADFRTNPAVARAVVQLVALLRQLQRTPLVEVWEGTRAKRIDDALVAKVPLTLLDVTGTDALMQELNTFFTTETTRGSMNTDPTILRASDDPIELARAFLQPTYTHASGQYTLRYFREVWYVWHAGVWQQLPTDELQARLVQAIDAHFVALYQAQFTQWQRLLPDERGDRPTVRKVSKNLVANVFLALQSLTIIPAQRAVPSWLDDRSGPDVRECLFTANGIIHLPALVANQPEYHLAATPCLFNFAALPFDFTLASPEPTEWLAFLHRLWPDEPAAVLLVQQWFGYCLVNDTRLQKLLLIIGPTRSGKGTLARVLTELVGKANTAAPTLGSLSERFGLWPLLDKTLAVIGDAQLSGRADATVITERLKGITGEDLQMVDRKNLSIVNERLGVRFTLLSNEVPKLNDASAVIANRILALRTTQSHLGKEDLTLIDRLLAELPGILHWAIAGWQQLRQQGKFTQPASGLAIIEQLRTLAAEVTAFVGERCRLGAGLSVPKTELFRAWQDWCAQVGRRDPGKSSCFGRDLFAAYPTLDEDRIRDGDDRVRRYLGIELRPSITAL